MDPTRRYSDEEVARILDHAMEVEWTGTTSPASLDGMTLTELQEIGLEVGISPELIAEGARALEVSRAPAAPNRVFLGTPIGVGRTVDLPRKLTDAEWERLVVDLRETFDARGRIHQQGPFRSWTNGNLQALLEPTESGERLRLRTLKGDARITLGGGAFMMALAPILLLVYFLTGGDALELALLMAGVGGALFTLGRISLPRWADTRQLQMDGIAGRLTEALEDRDRGMGE